jgi:hypothetical protein
MMTTALPTSSSAAAYDHAPVCRPLELLEARQRRDALKHLLRTEQSAMADFLIALADFDRRRGWVPLGHANLFAFLLAELGLSAAPTYLRTQSHFGRPNCKGRTRYRTTCAGWSRAGTRSTRSRPS